MFFSRRHPLVALTVRWNLKHQKGVMINSRRVEKCTGGPETSAKRQK